MEPSAHLTCRLCGHGHRPPRLAPGEAALCLRCGSVLARGDRLGTDSALAFTLTGILLAVPAATLPLVTVAKFGNEHACSLFSGAAILWQDGMRALACLVLLCGCVAPMLLLGTLAGLLLPGPIRQEPALRRPVLQFAHWIEQWAMPEVQLLALLVAFFKLANLVAMRIQPGLWCYGGMSLAILFGWRSFCWSSEAGHAPAAENTSRPRP